MQSALERRQELFEVMCECRHDTIDNLAFQFGVDRRTIERDIELLSLSRPIYTTKGTGGGVHIVDGYRYGNKYLTEEETEFLEGVATRLTGSEFVQMQKIINRFRTPKRGGR